LGLLILFLNTFSQNREIVSLRRYSQKDGLSSYNIRKIIQDKKGFLWIATQDGLSRYDGTTFINYSRSSKLNHRLCGVDVRELIEDTSKNLLWVLPGETGINAINTITGNVVSTINISYTNNEDWNISMIKDEDFLWIGTSSGIKIYNTKTKQFETSPPTPYGPVSSSAYEIWSMLKDESGKIWVCYSGFGIIIYDSKTKSICKEIPLNLLNDHHNSSYIQVFRCLQYKPGQILLATSQGIRKIYYNESYRLTIDYSFCKFDSKLNSESVDVIAKSDKNEIFIAGYNKLYKTDSSFIHYSLLEEPARTSEVDWLNAVQYIYFDHENNIWLGCQEGLGFMKNDPAPFVPFNYDKISNTKLDHVRSICPLLNGDILVGLRSGIVKIDHITNAYTKYDTGHLYHHIFEDKKGNIIVSRPDGIFIYTNGTLTPVDKVYHEFSKFSSVSINSHLYINDSIIILGSENDQGILIWNTQKKYIRKIEQTAGSGILSSSTVNNIYQDSKKNIWVLSNNVITVLWPDFTKKKEIILNDPKARMAYKLFFDMCEADGYFWLASYGAGILKLDSSYNIKQVLNTEAGLCNDGVYQIYDIENHNLLITSNNGISVFDIERSKFRNYFTSNGLHSNGFEEVSGLRKKDLIYAGGLNGFTVIDPTKFSVNNTPPVLYFTSIEIKTTNGIIDTSNLLMTKDSIQNNWLQTNISFTALNYQNPDRVTFEYRIMEQHTSWIPLGSQNFISLIGLPPGTYTLEVKAANEDGIWCEPKTLILTFEPKWYQTMLFNILVALAAASLIYGFFRYRLMQIRKQHQIRKEIAGDLHDDIGATLNGVKIFAHLAETSKDNKKYFANIKEALTHASTGLRDMIWVLDDSGDTISDLVKRLKMFAQPVSEASDISISFTEDSSANNITLNKTEKRNLLLIAKEAINNSIKYAECENIKVTFFRLQNKTAVKIEDDGKGFAQDEIVRGNGLNNMQQRARQIHYRITLESEKAKGTKITVVKK
jgi:ligand-binding sensor domain-containing protein